MKTRIRKQSKLMLGALPLVCITLAVESLASETKTRDVLWFASDVHDAADANLQPILSQELASDSYDIVALVGDYQSGRTSDTSPYLHTRSLLESYAPAEATRILTQGNHDELCPSSGQCYTHATGPVPTPTLYSDLYVINTKDFCSTKAIQDLDGYLKRHTDNTKAVVILSHFPLHSTRLVDSPGNPCRTSALGLFEVIDAQGRRGRDIVFVWGHNHRVPSYDAGVDYVVVPPSGTIGSGRNIDSRLRDRALYFTYLNAGYMTGSGVGEGFLASWSKVTISSSTIRVERHGTRAESLGFSRDYN